LRQKDRCSPPILATAYIFGGLPGIGIPVFQTHLVPESRTRWFFAAGKE